MKKIYYLVGFIIVIILAANLYYYFQIYKQQISLQESFLMKQTLIAGSEIEKTGYDLESELSKILFSTNISNFFEEEKNQLVENVGNHEDVLAQLRSVYFKYSDLVSNIQFYNNQKKVFSIYCDRQGEFITDFYASHEQKNLFRKDTVLFKNGDYLLYLPVLTDNMIVGNLEVRVSYEKYLKSVLEKSHIEDVQWQWIIDSNDDIIYINLGAEEQIKVSRIEKISNDLRSENQNVIQHKAFRNGREIELLSAYYPLRFIKRDFGIIFSLESELILGSLIRSSIIISSLTFLLVFLIAGLLINYIQKQKKKEADLETSRDKLFEIVESLPTGIIILDENRKIIRMNEEASNLFPKDKNIKAGEVLGDWFFRTGYPDSPKKIGKHFLNDVVIYKKENREIALYKKEVTLQDGDKNLFLESLIDITPFERARKQEAAAVKTKSDFLTNTSIEIQTPLNGIIGLLDNIKSKNLTSDQKKIHLSIRKTAELLLSILDDILTFSKIEAGDMVTEEIPFSLRSELDLALARVTPIAKEKNLDFKLRISKDVPDNLIGDPFKIRQTINHLAGNAVKFTSIGRINIKVEQLENTTGKITLQLIIEDSGIGIPKEDIKHLFDKDSNVNDSSARKFAGAGLGLALSRQMVELLNGEIKAESPSGISGDPEYPGSRFILTFEVYPDERIKKDIPLSKVTSYTHINALVIKSNDISGHRVADMLTNFGVKARLNFYHDKTIHLIESNAQEEKERHHILLLRDSVNFDAFEFAEQLKAKNLIEKYLVVITSSNDQKGNYVRSRKLGVDYYLIEPCQGSELFNILQDNFPNVRVVHSGNVLKSKLRPDINILLAEDNLMNQKLEQAFFKNLGYEIDIALNGLEVVKMVDQKDYDIIFMDVMMPEMDGWEATREVRNKGFNMPVVPITADFSEDAKERAITEDMNDFIAKPVRIEELKRVLMRWFTESSE